MAALKTNLNNFQSRK